MSSIKLRHLPVFIVLVGLPLVAYYFLQKGATMRKEAMHSLGIKSSVTNFNLLTDQDSVFTSTQLQGSRWAILFCPALSHRDSVAMQMGKLQEQSQEDFDPKFFIFLGIVTGEDPDFFSTLFFKYLNRKNSKLSYLSEAHYKKFLTETFKIPEDFIKDPCIAFVDESLQIRNYYNLNKPESVKKMIREYPVFLALKNKK